MKKSDNKPTTSQKANNEDATREELRHNLAIARAIMRLREENQAKETTEEQKPIEEMKFINEFHRKNYEDGMKYIAESKKSQINWEEEVKRQKRNSQNH